MTQFVIERAMPGAGSLSEAQLNGIALKSTAVMKDLDIQWVHSYVTTDKIYCIYRAPSQEAILEHARQLGLPVDRISPVSHLVGSEGVR